MANDKAAIWNQTIKLGRAPANGELLIGNGADFNLAALTAGSNVTITNTAGGISIASTNPGGTVTGVTASSPLASSGGTAPNISLSGTVTVGNGGTGATTLTANNVILGNGTSAVQFVAPGTSGNILTSNGTTWQSVSPVTTWTTVFKSSSQTYNTNTATDDTALTFSMDASGKYLIDCVIYLSQQTSNNAAIQCNGTNSASSLAASSALYATAVTNSTPGVITAYNTDIFRSSTGTASYFVRVSIYVANGSTASVFTMKFYNPTGASFGPTVQAGSYLSYLKVT